MQHLFPLSILTYHHLLAKKAGSKNLARFKTRSHGRVFRYSTKLEPTTMADSSNKYEPEEGSTDTSTGRTLRRRKDNDDTQVSGGNYAKKKATSAPTQRTSLPTNLRAIAGMENHISKQL